MSTLEEQFLALQQQVASLQAQLQAASTPMQSADDTAMPTSMQPGEHAAIQTIHSVETRPHYDWSPSDALMDLMELDTPIHTTKPLPDTERRAIIESYPPMAHLDYRAPATIPSAERLMNRGQKYEDNSLKQLQYLLSAVFRPLDILTKELFTTENGNPNLERYSIMLRDIRRLLLHVCSMMTQQRNNIALRAHDPSYRLDNASEVNYTLPLDQYQQTLTQQHATKKAIRFVRLLPLVDNVATIAPRPTLALFPMDRIHRFFDQVHPRSRVVSPTTATTTTTTTSATFVPTTTTATTTTTTTAATTTATRRTPTLFASNTNTNSNTNNNISNNRPSRRSAQQISPTMEKHHQQYIRYQYCSTRLPHSFSHYTPNNFNTNINYPILSRSSNTYRSGRSRLIIQISNREGVSSTGTTGSRFLQPHVRDTQEEWRRSPSLQSQTPQPISGGPSLQDGNNQGSIFNDQTKGLSRFNRLIRRIPSCRSSPRVTAVPTVQMEGSGLPILHDRFSFVIKSLCLHQSMQAYFGTLALSRLQDLSVLGRLVAHRQLKASSRNSGSPGGGSTRETRMAYQLQEIGATAHSTTGTSRLRIEYPIHDSNSTSQQDEGYTSFNQTSVRQTSSSVSQDHPQPDNADTGSDLCHLSDSSIHPTPFILQESDGEIRGGLGSTSPLGSGQLGGTSMVVSQHPQVERSVSTSFDTEPNHVCGRQQHGLGLLMVIGQRRRRHSPSTGGN